MSTLYELADQYTQVSAMAEVEDMDPQAIIDTLDAMEGEIGDKIENLCLLIKNLNAESEAITAEAKALQERAKAKANKVDSLKSYLTTCMSMLGKDVYESSKNKVSFRTSKYLDIYDEQKLEEYVRENDRWDLTLPSEIKFNKDAIKKAITTDENSGIVGVQISERKNLQLK